MPRHLCPVCLRPTRAGPCPEHRRQPYGPGWQERSRRAIAEHRALHGDWCPGWGVPAHETSDLTLDHGVAVANGGQGNVTGVLCRSCNGRKAAHRGPARKSPDTAAVQA